jgi:hypothetical protein
MAIEFPSLTGLSQEKVEQARALLVQSLREKSPSLEFRRGVIHDIIIHLESVIHAAQETYADKFRKSGSIKEISADPSIADNTLVDAVLSNFLITRKVSNRSTGSIIIKITDPILLVVAQGSSFTYLSKSYSVTSSFATKTNALDVSFPTDRLLNYTGDGYYSFTVDVQSDSVGEEFSLPQGSLLSPNFTIPGFISAHALNDFFSGKAEETNKELLLRLKDGITSDGFSNKSAIASLIKKNYPTVMDVAAIGFGDPEQTRYHGIMPISEGGKLDLYIKSEGIPANINIDVSAVLIGFRVEGEIWQASIPASKAYNFYDIVRVVKKEDEANFGIANGYGVLSISRSYDVNSLGEDFVPEIEKPAEGAFSKYQTATVTFLDTDNEGVSPLGTRANYSLTLRYQRNVKEIQDFLNSPTVRPMSFDVLVKGAIPLDLKIAIIISNRDASYVVDTSVISYAVSSYVNNLKMNQPLYKSDVISVIHGLLESEQSVMSVDMRGKVTYPTGAVKYINAPDVLTIPNDTQNMVTARTTAIFLNKSDVTIVVKSV